MHVSSNGIILENPPCDMEKKILKNSKEEEELEFQMLQPLEVKHFMDSIEIKVVHGLMEKRRRKHQLEN